MVFARMMWSVECERLLVSYEINMIQTSQPILNSPKCQHIMGPAAGVDQGPEGELDFHCEPMKA